MSGPYHLKDLFENNVEPKECPNPEECTEVHNESGHHYGCECGECMFEYWLLKS